MDSIISAKNLCRQYTTYKRGSSARETVKSLFKREKVVIDAVKNVSFDIAEGSVTGLLGKNGAGKSTTIKMLTGVLCPTSGDIDVMGFSPFNQRAKYVSRIGAVFGQKSQLIWDIPPADSFNMNKTIYRIPDAEYKINLNRMVELFEVSEIISKPTRSLSLGERMKCEFIMAMLHGPKIVFLDEPTIGLDIISKEKIRGFIQEMNKTGVTFILTTHDIGDVERLADRIIIINDGEKVYDDRIDALKKHLGDRKTVSVKMKAPIGRIELAGVNVLERPSGYEAELSVDNEAIDINAFVAYLASLGEIADISIRSLSVEEIIKSIYLR